MENLTKTPFIPIDVSNALRIDRPKHGGDVSIAVFRLLRLVVLEDLFGPAAAAQAYLAGKKLGARLGLHDIEQFVALCQQLKIGDVSIETHDDLFKVDVHECVTCAGMSPVGRPICSFEGGLVAGAIGSIYGLKVQAREITCIGGLGDRTCGFEVRVQR
ncbi:MAG: hypothetical protein HXY29_07520 [Rhodocyclaceae bacterium]|jgi:predicted hydrocarbon binding protein|nr:hypothetical protein [Rhodocyclaceae bacterium]